MKNRLWRRYRRGDDFFELVKEEDGRQYIQSFGAFDQDVPSDLQEAIDADDEEKLTATLVAMKTWADQNNFEPF